MRVMIHQVDKAHHGEMEHCLPYYVRTVSPSVSSSVFRLAWFGREEEQRGGESEPGSATSAEEYAGSFLRARFL